MRPNLTMALNAAMIVFCVFCVGDTLRTGGNVWMYPASIAILQSITFGLRAHEMNNENLRPFHLTEIDNS